MQKKRLIKTNPPPKGEVARPLCNTYGGSACTINGGVGDETDILF